ncbi:hypothetical protein Megpolyxen_01918 (plasmid) [Candidatus Megaera polyxenophila]|nr:hypothetical protein Megpolyxen_01918 [Candidatus Megaera polyxenophila]
MNKFKLFLHYLQGINFIKIHLYTINVIVILSLFFPQVFDYYHRLFAQLAAFILSCLTILTACDNYRHNYNTSNNEDEDF